jgi:hypothetical protein
VPFSGRAGRARPSVGNDRSKPLEISAHDV